MIGLNAVHTVRPEFVERGRKNEWIYMWSFIAQCGSSAKIKIKTGKKNNYSTIIHYE
jgi:hypothetical protein